MHMLLDHALLGHVGGGKWPGDEGKTLPYTSVCIDSGTLDPEHE